MAKGTTLRGTVTLKENTLTEAVGNEILSISATGVITKRPAIASGGSFVSSTLPSAQIIVGNGSNVATAVAMSGDVTISNTGVTAIGTGVIVNADVSGSAAIAYSKLALTGSIVNADVSGSAAIAYSKLNLATSIVNNDVAVAAAIVRTKLASGTAYRILANTSAGVMSENAALTATRVIVSDANGQLVAATPTTTEINYVAGVTSAIQTQLNTRIVAKATNALIQAPTASEDGFAITWDDGAQEWALTDPVIQGIPIGGSAGQFLGKNSGTDYDASWLDLVAADISDLTATAADLNVMTGADAASVTPTIIGYLGGATPVTSSIQAQLNTKQSSSLAQNSIWVGNGSNVAAAVAGGTNGYVLTSVGGVPTWQPAASGSASGSNNEVQTSDGSGGFVASNLFVDESTGDITIGDSSLAGASRNISTSGSATDVALQITTKGTGFFNVTTGGSSTIHTGSGVIVIREVSNANAVSTIFTLRRETTGSPANGIGGGLNFDVETTAGNETGAVIEAVATDVSSGSEDFDLVFKTMVAGATAAERLKINNLGLILPTGSLIGESGSTQINFDYPNDKIRIDGNSTNFINVDGASNQVSVETPIFLAKALSTFIMAEDGSTGAVAYPLLVSHRSTGTPTAGHGAGLIFEIETAVSNFEYGASIEAISTDVGSGTEDFDLVFKVMTAGSSADEKLRVASTGVLTIPNASTNAAVASAGGIILHSRDSSDANATLALYLEQTPEATATFTQTHRLKVWINGTEYWLSLDAV